MSFLDNTKNVGTAIWVVGIVEMILGLVGIITGVISDEIDTLVGIIGGLGGIITGFVYFGFGKSVRGGSVSGKWDIACRLVLLAAMATAITGIFGYSGDVGVWIGNAVISIIIAVIIYWVYTRMTAGGDNVINKILWILLVVVSVLSILSGIFMLFSFPIGTIEGICGIIVSLFLLVTLLDSEVKSKMGM